MNGRVVLQACSQNVGCRMLLGYGAGECIQDYLSRGKSLSRPTHEDGSESTHAIMDSWPTTEGLCSLRKTS